MKSPNKDYIHDPTFRHSGLVPSSGVEGSNNDARENECQYVTNILKENNYTNSPEGDYAVKGFAIVPYI